MYLSTARLQSAKNFPAGARKLPPEITSLYPRDQQIAVIVYETGFVTAKDVEVQLSGCLTNASVRSVLRRLVEKGVLLHQRCGKRGTIVYAPALTGTFARETALRQFADDFCGGSLAFLADELGDFFASRPRLDALLESYNRARPVQICGLSPRMGQIADVVYRTGTATIGDIQASLDDKLSTSCIRTLLHRMAARSMLKKRPSGRHRETVYLPTFVTRQVRRLALKRFLQDRFEDSTGAALHVTLQLIRIQDEQIL